MVIRSRHSRLQLKSKKSRLMVVRAVTEPQVVPMLISIKPQIMILSRIVQSNSRRIQSRVLPRVATMTLSSNRTMMAKALLLKKARVKAVVVVSVLYQKKRHSYEQRLKNCRQKRIKPREIKSRHSPIRLTSLKGNLLRVPLPERRQQVSDLFVCD